MENYGQYVVQLGKSALLWGARTEGVQVDCPRSVLVRQETILHTAPLGLTESSDLVNDLQCVEVRVDDEAHISTHRLRYFQRLYQGAYPFCVYHL